VREKVRIVMIGYQIKQRIKEERPTFFVCVGMQLLCLSRFSSLFLSLSSLSSFLYTTFLSFTHTHTLTHTHSLSHTHTLTHTLGSEESPGATGLGVLPIHVTAFPHGTLKPQQVSLSLFFLFLSFSLCFFDGTV